MTADAGWLAQTHAACFTHPRPWTAAEFTELLASPGATLVSHDHGFALARATVDEAEILAIGVLPEARQRGIAHSLLHQLETRLSVANTRYLHLEVCATNTPALALYYSHGFTESGRRSGYYTHSNAAPQDALILSKTLK